MTSLLLAACCLVGLVPSPGTPAAVVAAVAATVGTAALAAAARLDPP